jgi:methylmalonyl-CoA mutase, C-terminal domain
MPSDIRVLLAKPGLDGHFRGVATVGAALRDAGMEVVYTGPRQTPEQIVAAAFAEDVAVIGLNIMTMSAARVVQRLFDLLAEAGARDDYLVVVGGIIKPADVVWLREHGVDGVFGPGTPMARIVEFIRARVGED